MKNKNSPQPTNPPEGAHILTAAELNKYKFSDRHTILTPELLAKASSQNNTGSQ